LNRIAISIHNVYFNMPFPGDFLMSRKLFIVLGLVSIQFCGCQGTRGPLATRSSPEIQVSSKTNHRAPRPPGNRSGESTPAETVTAKQSFIELTAGEAGPSPIHEEVPVPDFPSSAPGEFATSWSLASLESTALANNPSIRQASSSAHKAIGFREQVGKRPNPMVGYNGTQIADRGTDQHTVFVEQQIVLGDKLSRNQEVLNQEVESQLWEVEAQRYRVLTDVRQRYYEALAAQRRLALTKEFHVIAQKGVDVAKARREAKEGSTPEVLQAEIQLNQVEIQRRQAEASFRGAWKQLMAVTGLPGTFPGALEGDLPSQVTVDDWQLVTSQTLAASPELQAAQARVSRARANIGRQEVQAIPNLTFMLAGGVDRGTNSGMINTQVGLPLPIYNRNEGNISAAQAEFSRACEEVRRLELSIESRIAQAGQEYESAAAAVEQYQQVTLPKAEEALALTEHAYAAGEFEFLQVLIVRKTYFDANLEYVVSQKNLALAEAYLQGMVLSGGLDNTRDTDIGSGLRDQSLGGE
jgi:cobalt-zinc-cadmium efflux system outer membrane protein